MLLNGLLLVIIIIAVLLLIKMLRKNDLDKFLLPICSFIISEPEFIINDHFKIVKFNITTSNGDRYFRDFPLGFKFYSEEKFKSKVKISYTEVDDNETEIIYDRIIEFDDTVKDHIYYINDIIIGGIDIEIYTSSEYGTPTILFEILQGNMCHMESDHKLEIVFPEKNLKKV